MFTQRPQTPSRRCRSPEPGEAVRGSSSSDGGCCESSGCPAAPVSRVVQELKRHPQPVLREESEETERGGLDEQRS